MNSRDIISFGLHWAESEESDEEDGTGNVTRMVSFVIEDLKKN